MEKVSSFPIQQIFMSKLMFPFICLFTFKSNKMDKIYFQNRNSLIPCYQIYILNCLPRIVDSLKDVTTKYTILKISYPQQNWKNASVKGKGNKKAKKNFIIIIFSLNTVTRVEFKFTEVLKAKKGGAERKKFSSTTKFFKK